MEHRIPKRTDIVRGEDHAKRLALALINRSRWFELTPLPDDQWEFKTKSQDPPIQIDGLDVARAELAKPVDYTPDQWHRHLDHLAEHPNGWDSVQT